MEGRVGFEPTDRFQSPDFKSGAIDLSTTCPILMVDRVGIEPTTYAL